MEFFKYCTLENPVFQSAIFWIGLFIFTGCFTIYYKIQEAQEAAEAEKLKKEAPKSEDVKPAAKSTGQTTPRKIEQQPKQSETQIKKSQPVVAKKAEESESKSDKKANKKKSAQIEKVFAEEKPGVVQEKKFSAIQLTQEEIDDGWNVAR